MALSMRSHLNFPLIIKIKQPLQPILPHLSLPLHLHLRLRQLIFHPIAKHTSNTIPLLHHPHPLTPPNRPPITLIHHKIPFLTLKYLRTPNLKRKPLLPTNPPQSRLPCFFQFIAPAL